MPSTEGSNFVSYPIKSSPKQLRITLSESSVVNSRKGFYCRRWKRWHLKDKTTFQRVNDVIEKALREAAP